MKIISLVLLTISLNAQSIGLVVQDEKGRLFVAKPGPRISLTPQVGDDWRNRTLVVSQPIVPPVVTPAKKVVAGSGIRVIETETEYRVEIDTAFIPTPAPQKKIEPGHGVLVSETPTSILVEIDPALVLTRGGMPNPPEPPSPTDPTGLAGHHCDWHGPFATTDKDSLYLCMPDGTGQGFKWMQFSPHISPQALAKELLRLASARSR